LQSHELNIKLTETPTLTLKHSEEQDRRMTLVHELFMILAISQRSRAAVKNVDSVLAFRMFQQGISSRDKKHSLVIHIN